MPQHYLDNPSKLDGHQMFMLPEKKSWKKAGILIPEIMDYSSFVFYGLNHAKSLGHNKMSKYILDMHKV